MCYAYGPHLPVPVLLVPGYVIQVHDRIVHVLEEFMLEAGAINRRDLRLEVHRNG
jgi:hypothetical protein